MNCVPPSYISCALCVFWKKAQQNKNLDSVLFAFFKKQHGFKRSHFDIECPLLAKGSYKIKIRVLLMMFRHLISVVRCACSEKSTAKQNLGSVLCKFELERSYFDKLLDSGNFCHTAIIFHQWLFLQLSRSVTAYVASSVIPGHWTCCNRAS